MDFGPIPVAEAEGAILAHSLRLAKGNFKKGRKLNAEDIEKLRENDITEVIAARLAADDIHEDDAAAAIAEAVMGEGLSRSEAFTGRCNLIADTRGLAVIDRARVDALNRIDEAVTLATIPPYELAERGRMVATVKIIPFAVAKGALDSCKTAAGNEPLVRMAPLRPRQVGLVQSRLPGTKEAVLDKTLEASEARLAALDCPPLIERRVDHETDAIAQALAELRAQGCELLLVSGASAIVDRRDIVPRAIEAAGGAIDHFGMPVDPGNLILTAHWQATPVLGLPGCARSPKVNGFDWVLQRLLCDLPVERADIMAMGAGGLLKETGQRPLPRSEAVEGGRAKAPRAPRIAALVLAAGQSRRMGRDNKLLAEVEGKPLVRHAVEAALASKAVETVVVTGHQYKEVEEAIADTEARVVHNPDYGAGLSTSLRRGLAALSREVDGVAVLLGDMPRITPKVIDKLIAAFNPVEGRAICVPTFDGKRGNPVLFATRFVPELQTLAGDVGARHLLSEYEDQVAEVAMEGPEVLLDIDTPEALDGLRKA